ncbi:MAG: MutT/NUDIX family protein [Herbinix sp.]|nr:MutT/NUDIX family protein [Herbinix sp.]
MYERAFDTKKPSDIRTLLVKKGDITSSDEGEVYWTKLDTLNEKKLADGMDRMLRVFLEEDISEHYWCRIDGEWKDELK